MAWYLVKRRANFTLLLIPNYEIGKWYSASTIGWFVVSWVV
jgi:hypothetical protein